MGYTKKILDKNNILKYWRLKIELNPIDEGDSEVRIRWKEYVANKIEREDKKSEKNVSEKEKDITEVIQEIWDKLNKKNKIIKENIGRMVRMGFTKYEIYWTINFCISIKK